MAIVDEVTSPESLPELIAQGRYAYKHSLYDSHPQFLRIYFNNSIPRNCEAYNSSITRGVSSKHKMEVQYREVVRL